MKCPCCGSDVLSLDEDALKYVKASAIEMTILQRLHKSYPGTATMANLLWEVYHSRNDQPDNAVLCLTMAIQRLRKRLEKIGWTIPRNVGGRSKTAVYRLEKIQ